LGCPLFLMVYGCQSYILLAVRPASILEMCPSQLILWASMKLTMFLPFIRLSSLSFVLIPQVLNLNMCVVINLHAVHRFYLITL
jgi:hypothetical protein